MYPVYLKRIFLIFSLLSFYTFCYAQKVTVQQSCSTLAEIFSAIEKQTYYTIAYPTHVIDMQNEYSVSFVDWDLEDVLKEILKDTGLSFKIKKQHIIIFPDNKQREDASITHTIRGIVVDSQTGLPLSHAAIGLLNGPPIGEFSDINGEFTLVNIPVGRYDLQVSLLGYTSSVLAEIPVGYSKEVNLVIPLTENSFALQEIEVFPVINKENTLNPMVLTGGRIISMEEASRFANGFDDPARLISAFAGVAGNIESNAVSIRGNSPLFTQWRLEGIEIPNPTHFADQSNLGGGFLSALSTNVMGNSDFYNGAFPAEYTNALSGVFDMYMRNGNNRKHEHAFQVGILGVDLASEGPISKKQGSSYIINYRFSTTALAATDEESSYLRYQDISFKLHFPTKKAGTFSLWGLGLKDRNKTTAKDPEDWEILSDRQIGKTHLEKVAGGLIHLYPINGKMSLKTSLAATFSQDRMIVHLQDKDLSLIPVGDIKNRNWDFVFSSSLKSRFSSRHVNKTGIVATNLNYNLDYQVSPGFGLNLPMEEVAKGKGNNTDVSVYSYSVIDINKNFAFSAGITSHYFALNNNYTLEPRISMKWRFSPLQTLAISYGLHSKRERLNHYYVDMSGDERNNKNLSFTKAHHTGISYIRNMKPNLIFKIEPYFQYLYDVPVEAGTSFSIINHNQYYLDRILTNEGKSINYGIDLTLEQYMNKGFYYLASASLFKSKYKGGDEIWRSTRFDQIFLVNAVTGKEWLTGKNKHNILNTNIRLGIQGGERYTPIDPVKTMISQEIEYDETNAFGKKYKPGVTIDFSIKYRINRRKISHEFFVNILNIGGYTNKHFYQYNEQTKEIDKVKGFGIIPNFGYKIYF